MCSATRPDGPARLTCGRSVTLPPGATRRDTKRAWNIGATSPIRPGSWCPQCWGRTCRRPWSSRTSGATDTTSSACLGEPEATDTVHLVEDDGRKFLAYYERDGVLVGVVGGGMPGKVMKVRGKIAARAPVSEMLG